MALQFHLASEIDCWPLPGVEWLGWAHSQRQIANTWLKCRLCQEAWDPCTCSHGCWGLQVQVQSCPLTSLPQRARRARQEASAASVRFWEGQHPLLPSDQREESAAWQPLDSPGGTSHLPASLFVNVFQPLFWKNLWGCFLFILVRLIEDKMCVGWMLGGSEYLLQFSFFLPIPECFFVEFVFSKCCFLFVHM